MVIGDLKVTVVRVFLQFVFIKFVILQTCFSIMEFLPSEKRNTKCIGALKVTRLPRWASAPSKLPLEVTKVSQITVIPPQSIAIYSDPAPAQVVIGAFKVTKASLFTVTPRLGFPKYCYLQ